MANKLDQSESWNNSSVPETDNSLTQEGRALLGQNVSRALVANQVTADVATVGLPSVQILHPGQPDVAAPEQAATVLASATGTTERVADAPPAGQGTQSGGSGAARDGAASGGSSPVGNDATQPEVHTVQKGDSLWKIAKEHLGEHATNKDTMRYVYEIAANNHFHNLNQIIHPGDKLAIPQYNPEGSFSLKQVVPAHHGATRQHGEPPPAHPSSPEAQLPVVPPRDAQPSDDQTQQRAQQVLDDPVIIQERQKLLETATLSGANTQDIQGYSQKFEKQMQKEQEVYEKQGMSVEDAYKKTQQEITGTYQQVERLYESNGTDKVSARQEHMAALEVLRNAANPDHIDQGHHGTCGANAVESLTYRTEPSKAAKLVADVALTGQYTAPDGTTVKINDPAPHGESNKPMQNKVRNYASELFQVTAINVAWTKIDPDVHYEQRKVVDSGGHDQTTGEYLIHSDGSPVLANGKPINNEGLEAKDLEVAYSTITGKKEEPAVLIGEKPGDKESDKQEDRYINSPQELAGVLQERGEHGKLPMFMAVNAGKAPFSDKEGGGHAILITGYIPGQDGQPAEVTYDNWWGKDSTNRTVSLEEMYQAMIKN